MPLTDASHDGEKNLLQLQTSRSQTVATLRKLTGESSLTAPEQGAIRTEISAQAMLFATSLIGITLLGYVLVQQAAYDKQIELATAAGAKAQVLRSFDGSPINSQTLDNFRTPVKSISARQPVPATPKQAPAPPVNQPQTDATNSLRKHAPTDKDPTSGPTSLLLNPAIPNAPQMYSAMTAQSNPQLHLADQLAGNGQLGESAASLMDAVAKDGQNTQLRVAAIRAELRIQDYSTARQLCVDGKNGSSNNNDSLMFGSLLKNIPSH